MVVEPIYSSYMLTQGKKLAVIKIFDAEDPSLAYLHRTHPPSIPRWIQIGVYVLKWSSCKGTEQSSITNMLLQCLFSSFLYVHAKCSFPRAPGPKVPL